MSIRPGRRTVIDLSTLIMRLRCEPVALADRRWESMRRSKVSGRRGRGRRPTRRYAAQWRGAR